MFDWKKKHFKKKLKGVDTLVADLEFKRFTTRVLREEKRVEYDDKKFKAAQLTEEMKRQDALPNDAKDKLDKGERNRLDDRKTLLERDIQRTEDTLKALDLDVNGSPQTNEYPDGVQGINQQLENLRDLKGMLTEYIKQL